MCVIVRNYDFLNVNIQLCGASVYADAVDTLPDTWTLPVKGMWFISTSLQSTWYHLSFDIHIILLFCFCVWAMLEKENNDNSGIKRINHCIFWKGTKEHNVVPSLSSHFKAANIISWNCILNVVSFIVNKITEVIYLSYAFCPWIVCVRVCVYVCVCAYVLLLVEA